MTKHKLSCLQANKHIPMGHGDCRHQPASRQQQSDPSMLYISLKPCCFKHNNHGMIPHSQVECLAQQHQNGWCAVALVKADGS